MKLDHISRSLFLEMLQLGEKYQILPTICKSKDHYLCRRDSIYSVSSGFMSALDFQYSPVGRIINLRAQTFAATTCIPYRPRPALIFNENCWFSLISFSVCIYRSLNNNLFNTARYCNELLS